MRNRSTDIWENVAAARIPCRKLRTVCTHGMDFLASVASEGGALSKIAPRVYTWGAPFDNVETPTSLQQGERTSGASLHVGNLVPCVHAGRGFWQSPATNVCADGAYGTPRRFGHLPDMRPPAWQCLSPPSLTFESSLVVANAEPPTHHLAHCPRGAHKGTRAGRLIMLAPRTVSLTRFLAALVIARNSERNA